MQEEEESKSAHFWNTAALFLVRHCSFLSLWIACESHLFP